MIKNILNENRQFDHIVIGAGSAGCAAARRLLDAGKTVGLVEAGGPINDERITDITRMWELWGLETDWNIKSVPQTHSNGTVIDLPRGKVLGGSSAMYGLVHARGTQQDFNSWAIKDAPGWAWDDVLPVYKRMEDFEGGASEYRGVGGPMPVSLNHTPNRLTTKFVEAAQEFGLDLNPDYNGESPDGVTVAQINVRDKTRVTSWDAYLAPMTDHPNLTVLTNTRALQLLLDGTDCTGVLVEHEGTRYELSAREEVILSAGAYHSPHLLMLSGIGEPEELQAHGIEVQHALPGVGKNLQDHILVPIVFESKKPIEPQRANGTECHFFAKSDSGLTSPDLQPILVARGLPVRGEEVPEQAFTFLAGVIRPFSVGTVTLHSDDPYELPKVDPNYFSDPEDMKTMLAAIEYCRGIAAQDALSDERGKELFPGSEVNGPALEEYIKDQVQTYHHPSGTCKMGRGADAVVDPKLRVRGLTGLRVADCSVFPFVPSGNTHAPAVLVGERVADFILADSTSTSDSFSLVS